MGKDGDTREYHLTRRRSDNSCLCRSRYGNQGARLTEAGSTGCHRSQIQAKGRRFGVSGDALVVSGLCAAGAGVSLIFPWKLRLWLRMTESCAFRVEYAPTSLQVLEKWREALVAAGAPNSDAVADVVLEAVRRSRVLLTARPEILKALFTSFPDGQIRVIATSPLWTSEADWRDDLAYLQHEPSRPRLLIIENFDAALQDAYLVPALLAWLTSLAETSLSRVALVPSSDDLSDVTSRVLEISTCLAYKAPHLGWPQFDEKRLKARLQARVAADLVKFIRSTDSASERGLSQYLHNKSISLPVRLTRNFANVYDGIRALLPPQEARVVAQDTTLIPWGERALSATQLTLLRSALDGLDEP